MTKYFYQVVSDYEEDITGGHFKGQRIGSGSFRRHINTKHQSSGTIQLEENISEMWKPFFRRRMGARLLQELSHEDELVFFTSEFSAASAKDLFKVLNWCHDNLVTVIILTPKSKSTHGEHNICKITPGTFSSRCWPFWDFMDILIGIGSAEQKFKRIKGRVTNYHRKKKKLACGNTPLGFTKNSYNKLIPDWDAQVMLRLIGYLKDTHRMPWTDISRRLAFLYGKSGRHYPTASKAKKPWSPQMCIKGYNAWHKIKLEDTQ